MKNKLCPYCNSFIELKDSKVVYGKSYGLIYICSNFPKCDAYVGVHKGTEKPLGSLASRYLRGLRNECHKKFDTKWEDRKERKEAYKWLQSSMGLNKQKAHFAKFNEEQCVEFLEL